MAYASVTRATLRARLQDRYEAAAFWTDTEANDAINEALQQFNLFTGYWRGSSTVNTVANGVFLTVPGTLTYRSRVTRSGKVLVQKSLVELFRQRKNWRTQTTASGGAVPTTVQEWAPIGLKTIAIWPADAAGGTTLTIEAVKLTPVLSADASFVDLGDEELGLLLDEALWILMYKRPSELEGQRFRHDRFLQGCLDRNDLLRGSSYFRARLGLDPEQALKPIRAAKTPAEAEA